MEYNIGDIVKTKKQHPCGSKLWELTRVGVDFKLKCKDLVLYELNKRGYFVKYKVLNTCEYSSVPQNRERIYIIAFKNKDIYPT